MPDKRFFIYADHAVPETDTLYGVVVMESKNNDITRQIFAKAAMVIIETDNKFTEVTINAKETYQLDKNDDPSYYESFSIKHRFPPMLSDNIKFQKIDRLKEIRADMSKFKPVRDKILAARTQLATEALAEDIASKLKDPEVGFYQLDSEDHILRVFSKRCKAMTDNTVRFDPPIEVMEYNRFSYQLNRKWNSDDEAELKFVENEPDSKLGLTLTNTLWQKNKDLKAPTPIPTKVFPGIKFTPEISKKMNKRTLIDTINTIGNPETEDPIIKAEPSSELAKLKDQADYEIWVTSKKILSEVHTRLVFGIGSITLVLFAVALGIIFKGGHILSAFGASSVPAAVLIVFIMSGKELTRTRNAAMSENAGIIVMWSGLIGLSIIAFMIYRKLLKT